MGDSSDNTVEMTIPRLIEGYQRGYLDEYAFTTLVSDEPWGIQVGEWGSCRHTPALAVYRTLGRPHGLENIDALRTLAKRKGPSTPEVLAATISARSRAAAQADATPFLKVSTVVTL